MPWMRQSMGRGLLEQSNTKTTVSGWLDLLLVRAWIVLVQEAFCAVNSDLLILLLVCAHGWLTRASCLGYQMVGFLWILYNLMGHYFWVYCCALVTSSCVILECSIPGIHIHRNHTHTTIWRVRLIHTLIRKEARVCQPRVFFLRVSISDSERLFSRYWRLFIHWIVESNYR